MASAAKADDPTDISPADADKTSREPDKSPGGTGILGIGQMAFSDGSLTKLGEFPPLSPCLPFWLSGSVFADKRLGH